MSETTSGTHNETICLRDRIERGGLARVFRAIPGHANQVTAIRVPIAAADAVLHAAGLPVTSATLFLANTLLDWVDGGVARAKGQTTKEGANLDPLCDKAIVAGHLVYCLVQLGLDTSTQVAAAINIAVDGVSHAQRGSLAKQFPNGMWQSIIRPETCDLSIGANANAANKWGKLKMALQCVGVGGLLVREQIADILADAGIEDALTRVDQGTAVVLGIAAAAGAKGIYGKIKLKRTITPSPTE